METRNKVFLKKFRFSHLFIFATICILLFLTYEIFRSYETLDETFWSIQTKSLSSEVKLVVLADLHEHEFGSDNCDLVSEIQTISPDLILMVGDFVNEDSENANVLLNLVEQLCQVAPVYFSLGNHEIAYMSQTNEDLLTEINDVGATVLELEYEDIEIAGETIRIGGMYDYAFAVDGYDSTNPDTMEPDIYQFLVDFQDTDNFKIMMAHRPDSFVLGEASTTWSIDLVVSGHVHGGQVVLPFVGGLWAPEQGWFPEYVHGIYEKERLCIFITSGLGSQPEKISRLNNPPEIAVITIYP